MGADLPRRHEVAAVLRGRDQAAHRNYEIKVPESTGKEGEIMTYTNTKKLLGDVSEDLIKQLIEAIDKDQFAFADPDLSEIARIVCEVTKVSETIFFSKSQRGFAVEARAIFCKIAYERGRHTTTKIGKFINRDHATVLHCLETVDNRNRLYIEFSTTLKYCREAVDKYFLQNS